MSNIKSRLTFSKRPGRPAAQKLPKTSSAKFAGQTYTVVMVSEYAHEKKVKARSKEEAIKFAVSRERSRDRFASRGYSLGDIHVVGVEHHED